MQTSLPAKPSTLLHLFRSRVAEALAADAPAFTFLDSGETVSAVLSFADLDRQARRLASAMQQSGVRPNDRVVLAYPAGLDFVCGFWACMYAGAVAVPALAPSSVRKLPRLRRIVEDASPALLLTTVNVAHRLQVQTSPGLQDALANVQWLTTDDPDLGDEQAWICPQTVATDIAFLQYTSGSTSAPKGVMVSHGNILANLALISWTVDAQPGYTSAFWLPAYHDFGLIGAILHSIHIGGHCVLFDPAAFLSKPFRWLKVISDYKANITGAPNFAYALCVDKITPEQRAQLDLRSLRIAVNGAERVRQDTLERFYGAFAECGLRADVIRPSYGLAESVLLVSGARPIEQLAPGFNLDADQLARGRAVPLPNAENHLSKTLKATGLGPTESPGHRVLIVDPKKLEPLPDGHIGEIWVQGPSVAIGYWNNPEASAAFFAQLPEEDGRFLRTGDLGFRRDGSLYATGRIKELIVLQGRNLYPQDLEATVEVIDPAFRRGGCAVFALEEENEGLVIVQELDFRKSANTDNLAARILEQLLSDHDLTAVASLLLVPPGQVPRTSSGKLQRLLCRDLYLNEKLDIVWQWRRNQGHDVTGAYSSSPAWIPNTDTERLLATLWSEATGSTVIGINDNIFTHLGGNSLMATQLASRLCERLDIELPLRALYEAPNMPVLAAEIDRLRRAAASTTSGVSTPKPLHMREPRQVSFAQQRLWLLDQMQMRHSHYIIPCAMRISGALNTDALHAALNEIVRRHETLRTRFRMQGEQVFQHVDQPSDIDMAIIDLRHLAPEDREALITQRAQQEAVRPFDLSRDAPMRVALIRTTDTTHVLQLMIHHIAGDLWSMGVFMRELSAIYAACAKGRVHALPALGLQYTDFSEWQRQHVSQAVIHRDMPYWKQELGGMLPQLDLPTDRPRPAVQSLRGASIFFPLDSTVTQRLRNIGIEHGATLYMVMLAAFKVLLHRHTQQDDLIVASPIANRNRAQTEGMIGFFVNTLLMRSRPAPDLSFTAFLARVRETALNAYAHQDLPFDLLVAELQPERETTYTPLFRTMFTLQRAPSSDLALPGLELDDLRIRNGSAKFDLTLFLWESQDGIEAEIEYSTDLFDESTIIRWGGHLRRLLAAIAEQPHARLIDLQMMDEHERRCVLQTWNPPDTAYPSDQAVPALFESQAARTPQALAVVEGDCSLSYAQLNAHANQVAHRLLALGAGAETPVALCIGRSIESVVAMLGVLKSGACMVPLDSAYPAHRLKFMLEDSGASILLMQTGCCEALQGTQMPTLLLDTLSDLSGVPSINPGRTIHPDQLAYITYTSGSTGRPKAVAVPHRGVVRLVKDNPYVDFDMGTFLHMSALTFDATTFELMGPLLNGGKVVVAPAGRLSPQDLGKVMQDGAVDTAFLTSSLFNLMIEDHPHALSGMRRLLVGGEAGSVSAFEKAATILPMCRLANGYGPTEVTTFSACYDATSLSPGSTSVPIGRGIANTQLYVLDQNMAPAPIGVTGDLYIAGPGLARGYRGQPGLTAQRFVPHPFSQTPGARLYRTGDLARWLPSGQLDFVGRLDDQVKIRGFRIELGEIENVIAQHPLVKESVAIARQDRPGEKTLVAYAVPRSTASDADARRLQEEQVDQWRSLYDTEVYAGQPATTQGNLNLAGWNSSYTGQAIPQADMQEWVDCTVSSIQALAPRRIWEIGCGTGLLLLRLASGTQRYLGTDFSAPALAHVASQLPSMGLDQVALVQRMADDFTGCTPGEWDMVVLNSIVQYFPSLDYLLKVIEGAIDTVADGGTVFLGDLRDHALLRQFHTSVQLFQAKSDDTVDTLRERVRRQTEMENELTLAPALFASLPQRFGRIRHVEVRHKRGRAHNEMSCYRYDVVLHIGKPEAATSQQPPDTWLQWGSPDAPHQLADLPSWLSSQHRPVIALHGVPNARVWADNHALRMLDEADLSMPAAQLRELSSAAAAASAIDPEDLAISAHEHGYRTHLHWSGRHDASSFDAILTRDDVNGSARVALPPDSALMPPWDELANNPLMAQATAALIPQLRSLLKDRLPEHAQPAHIILLDRLPLNVNGKLDTRRLPAPLAASGNNVTPYTAPGTPTEIALAKIWSALLRVERISVHDNFFELGGHSLLASQTLSRIRDQLGVELSLKQCFLHPTLRGLAELIDAPGSEAPRAPRIQRLPRRAA